MLPSIYQLKQYEYAINDHLLALLSILPRCDLNDRLSLLGLFELMAKSDASVSSVSLTCLYSSSASSTCKNSYTRTRHHSCFHLDSSTAEIASLFVTSTHLIMLSCVLQLLEGNLTQLTQYLGDENTAPTVLRIFVEVSNSEPQLVVDILPKVRTPESIHSFLHLFKLHHLTNVPKVDKANIRSTSFYFSSLRSMLICFALITTTFFAYAGSTSSSEQSEISGAHGEALRKRRQYEPGE